MINGVPVDRPRAKAVYDARVRERVDPGVAEVASDNLFHAQVNPISPGGPRTISLRFVMPVSPSGYHIPIGVAAPIETWRVSVQASGIDAAPDVHLPGNVRFTSARTATGYAGEVERARTSLNGEISIAGGSILFRDFGRATQREEAIDVEVTRDDSGAKMIGRMIVAKPTGNSK